MRFDWISIEGVDDAVIKNFDCGNHAFNDFIHNKAKLWSSSGESVTYVFIDEDEKGKEISRIYGFASINTMGLLYDNNGNNEYLPCAEIRLFAIAQQLRKHHDSSIEWSDTIFKTLLQNLYEMSTKVIGFKAIFLNANHDGYDLYIKNGFDEITDFIKPETDEKIDIEDCTPLLLIINDEMLYSIFS